MVSRINGFTFDRWMRLNAKRAGVASIPFRSASSSQDAFIRDTRTGPTYSERASSASALSENLDTSERLSAALTNLTYVRDLLTQARDIGLQASGTESERSALSVEANQLIEEANNILKNSSYSNKSVFNPSNPSVTLRTSLSGRRSEEFTLVDTQVVTPGSRSMTSVSGGAGDEIIYSLENSADGSVYVVGSSTGNLDGKTNAGATDVLLTKYAPDGSKAWSQLFGTASDDSANEVVSDSAGSVYVAGYTYGNLDGIANSQQGTSDGFLKKLSADGSTVWTRLIGTTEGDAIGAVSVGSDGNIYVAGTTNGALDGQTSFGNSDVFIASFDSQGTKRWTRTFGSAQQDNSSRLITTSTGVFVIGHTEGSLDGQAYGGNGDAFITRYDTSGNRIWTRQINSSGFDAARDVTVGQDGSLYITGFTDGSIAGQTNSGSQDAFLIKMSQDGSTQWTKLFGNELVNRGRGVTIGKDGYIYVTGMTQGGIDNQPGIGGDDVFLTKFKADGSRIWSNVFGTAMNDNMRQAIGTASDGSIFLAGETYGDLEGKTNQGARDMFISKINPESLGLLKEKQVIKPYKNIDFFSSETTSASVASLDASIKELDARIKRTGYAAKRSAITNAYLSNVSQIQQVASDKAAVKIVTNEEYQSMASTAQSLISPAQKIKESQVRKRWQTRSYFISGLINRT